MSYLNDPKRLASLAELGLLDTPAEEAFDRLTRLVSRFLTAPVSLVSLVTEDRQFFKSAIGLEGPVCDARQTPLSHSFCQHVVTSGEPLVINDAVAHPLVAGNLAIRDLGVRSYLGFPLRTPDGFVVGSFCAIDRRPREWSEADIETLRDLAELVVAQIALRHAMRQKEGLRDRLEKISARVPGVIYQFRLRPDGSSCFPYASEGIREIYRVAPGDVVAEAAPVFAILHPDDVPGVVESINRSAETLETWRHEYRVRFPDGTERWLLGESVPEREPDGGTLWHGFITDVTVRKHADQRLRAALDQVSRQQFAMDQHSIVAMTDLDGVVVYANRKFQEISGYTEAELIGRTHRLINSGVHPREFFQDMFAVITAGKVWWGEICNRARDGTVYWVAATVVPFYDVEGRPERYVTIQTDISAQKRAAAELRRANELQDAILASTDYIVVATDTEGVVTHFNRAGEILLGYAADEVLGRATPALWHDAGEVAARAAALSSEFGRPVAPGFDTFVAKARETGEADRNEWNLIRRDGTRFPVLSSVTCLHDVHGAINGYLGVVQDLSELKKHAADRARLDKKIADTAKLESLGVLAGGIAHDFNNLLTTVLGNASLLRTNLGPESGDLDLVGQIEQASRRAADLCKQMLAYSGRGRFVIQAVNLNQIIRETARLLEISISKHCVLRFQLTDPLPLIEADATQMRQILMNLIINASEAIGERSGVVAIGSGLSRVGADYLRSFIHGESLAEGDYVFVEISDNGDGMTAETLARIFDPFFSTKFAGRGLGLAAVLGIVRGHRGAIKVYSEPDKGSTFRLLFPCLSTGENPEPAAPPARPADWKGNGNVLVVDDEESVRVLSARLFERMGFAVELANDGREAVELFAADPQKFDLVLLDLTMPRLDGEETFRQLRHLRPGVRVILVSGFNQQEVMTRFAGKGLAGFLQKPFEIKEFQETVRAISTAS